MNPISWILFGMIAIGIITWLAAEVFQKYENGQEKSKKTNPGRTR